MPCAWRNSQACRTANTSLFAGVAELTSIVCCFQRCDTDLFSDVSSKTYKVSKYEQAILGILTQHFLGKCKLTLLSLQAF